MRHEYTADVTRPREAQMSLLILYEVCWISSERPLKAFCGIRWFIL
jgi:hypothetical protein